MFSQERQRLILTALADEGRVRVPALAARLNVSDDTVRRDLRALAEQGVLQKTHGGAVALDVPRMTRDVRARILPEAKVMIGRAAADRIEPHQTIMLDAGQTVLEVARNLPAVPLIVITHSLDIALSLAERADIRLVLAGGEWDARQRLFRGFATQRMIGSYRADLAIMGACAIHPDLGVTASDEADAAIKQAMLQASARKILVADHTKLDRQEPHFVAPIEAFDELITDRAMALKSYRPAVQVVGRVRAKVEDEPVG
jgi:DeoR family transcriptional regulator, glycerol-3-phosphate regulon repressor